MAEYVKATLAELPTDASVAVGSRGWVTTGDKIYEWDGDSWVLRSISGATLVTPQGGYAGPEGTPPGEKLTAVATNVQSAAIVGTLVDIIASHSNTLPIFVLIDDGTGPAVVDTSYPIMPGETRRFPITNGNKVNAICSAAGPNYAWVHPVEGDV